MNDKITDISLILKDLLKVIKVVSMYPEDNPLPQSLKRSFAEKLASNIEIHGDIKIGVDKDFLTHEGEVVFTDRSKEESLASLFFSTGITNFTFKLGFDVNEIYILLDVLKNYINAPNNSEDLVAMIWETGITKFIFTTIEDVALAEYDGKIDFEEFIGKNNSQMSADAQPSGGTPHNYKDIFNVQLDKNYVSLDEDTDHPRQSNNANPPNRGGGRVVRGSQGNYASMGAIDNSQTAFGDLIDDEQSFNTAEAVQAMGFGDIIPQSMSAPAPTPDTTIILNKEFELSQEAEKFISDLNKEDADFDIYESSVKLLNEMLHQETEVTSFNETVTIIEKIMNEILSAGKFLEASQLFTYLKDFGDKIRKEKPMWAERIKDAEVTIGSRERLKVVAEALNFDSNIGVNIFRPFLENFGWEAISGLTDMMGDLKNEFQREALCDFLAIRGKNKIGIISKGIYDKRPEIVSNTITVLARIDSDQSLNYLLKVIDHKNREVRLNLAISLRDNTHMQAVEILKILAVDDDSEVRKEAVKTIGTLKGKLAFETITEIINNEKFETVEHEHQQQLLNAFSSIGGDIAVTYLSQLIMKYNLTHNSTLQFFRQAAFEALSINKSEKAEKALLKFTSSWRPNIKQQAINAFHTRRSLIYGDDDE